MVRELGIWGLISVCESQIGRGFVWHCVFPLILARVAWLAVALLCSLIWLDQACPGSYGQCIVCCQVINVESLTV